MLISNRDSLTRVIELRSPRYSLFAFRGSHHTKPSPEFTALQQSQNKFESGRISLRITRHGPPPKSSSSIRQEAFFTVEVWTRRGLIILFFIDLSTRKVKSRESRRWRTRTL